MSQSRAGWKVVATAAILLAGCAKQPARNDVSVSRSRPDPMMASDAGMQRVQTLSRLAEQYARQAHDLPGGEQDYRRLMSGIFARLGEILPLLEGPNPTRMFQQQIQIIDGSRAELTGSSSDLALEPTISTGLRAAYDAVSTLSRNSFYEDPELSKTMDAWYQKLNDLDVVHGPLSRITASEAVELSSDAISKMANTLGQRMAEEKGAAQPPTPTEPAPTEPQPQPPMTEPAAAPTTEPAPAPAEPPATAPVPESGAAAPASTEPAGAAPARTEPAATEPAPAAAEAPTTAPAGGQ